MSKLIEVTDWFNNSKFLINTGFIIKCISFNSRNTEITVQYGDKVVNYKVKETLGLYGL